MSGELLPARAVFIAGEPVRVELVGAEGDGILRVFRLGDQVMESVAGNGAHDLGLLEPGGYGVEWHRGSTVLRTALDVQGDRSKRHRYGFVAAYPPGRVVEAFNRTLRRFHLTDVQFYDWGYRHADLLGGGHDYSDTLNQPISLDTVARLIGAARSAGARSLGYAAVYGVGNDEWDRWAGGALLDAVGTPYALGDFLRIVDPAWKPWLEHFVGDLESATRELDFDGFHLDQYGYPKVARRADGEVIDVAQSFVEVISAVRTALPEAHLVFNNVNDFDTRRTAEADQDIVYIEPWAPTTTLGDLAAVATRARAAARGKPIVFAAYQAVYTSAPTEEADRATALTMATLFSHGATQLLVGEDDRILVDPYYVKNQQMADSTEVLLRAYLDFLVEHDEVLLDPQIDDVTAAMTGEYNDDCDVTYEDLPVAGVPTEDGVWRRVTRSGNRLIVHLINLHGQGDLAWDGPKRPFPPSSSGLLRVRAVGGGDARVRVAEPLVRPMLEDVDVVSQGSHFSAVLPPVHVWQIVVIELV